MAGDLNRSIKIYLDNSDALQSADKLKSRIGELEKKLLDLQTAGQGNSAQAKKVSNEIKTQTVTYEKYKQKVAETERVLKNLSGATYTQLTAAKKAVEAQLKKTERGTELYNQRLRVHQSILKQLAVANKDMRLEVGKHGTLWGRAADGINRYAGLVGSAIASITMMTMTLNRFREERDKLEEKKADVKALTGLDDESVEWLTNKAKELSTHVTQEGVRIRAGAADILEAYKVVGGAKADLLENKEALAEVTKQTLILATASRMDMKDAAEAAILSMNQYGAAAEDASRYVNVLAAGSAAGAAEVDNIVKSVVRAGVSAAQANVPIEQLVGSIETLAERGIKDEIAGTGLKSFFLELQKGADDTNPRVVGLIQALENLNAKNMTAEELMKKFGKQGYNVASVMIESADKVRELTEAVTGTTVAIEQAQIVSETGAAKRAQAVNELKLIGVELLEKLNPAILATMNSTVNWSRKFIELLSWMMKNSDTVISLVTAIGVYTAAVKLNTYWKTVSNGESLKAIAIAKGELILTKSRIASMYAMIAAKRLFTLNVRTAMIAMKGFLVTLGLNPFTAVAVAITAIGMAIYKIWDNTTKAQRAIKEMNKEIASEQASVEALFDALNRANEGSERRKELIDEINSRYGSYMENLLTEKSTTEEIASALATVNEKLRENIVLKTMRAEKEKVLTEGLSEQMELMENMRKSSWHKDGFVTDKMLEDIKTLTDEGLKSGKTWEQTYASIMSELKRTHNSHGNLSASFNAALRGYVSETAMIGVNLEKINTQYSMFLNKREDTKEKTLPSGTITPEKKDPTHSLSEDEQKKALDAKLKNLDAQIRQERIMLQEAYLNGEMDKIKYQKELEMLEWRALERRFDLYNLDKNKQAEVQEAILKHRMKMVDAMNSFEASQEKYKRNLEKTKQKEEEKRKADQKKAWDKEIKESVKRDQQLAEDAFNKELERRKKFIEITQSLATDIGGILGGALSGNSDMVKSSMVSIINMGLDMLKIQCQMAVAGATMQSLASAESVATLGAAGFAKAAVMVGLIEAAFATVKGVVGNLVGKIGSGGDGSINIDAPETGRRVVSGFSDGGWTGDGGILEVAGDVHRREYVVPAWEVEEPRAMNHILALEAIRRQRSSANPLPANVSGFAEGGYTGGASSVFADSGLKVDAELIALLKELKLLLSWIRTNPLKAYVVLSELQAKQELKDKARNIGGK